MKTGYRTRLHRILELGAWLILLASLLVAVYGVRTLPEEIATHFALDGTPDGYGSPAILFLTPLLMVPCLGIVSLIAHLVDPAQWNMPFAVREERKAPVYGDILTMLHAIQLEIAGFSLYMQVKSYQQSGDGLVLATVLLTAALAVTIIGLCILAYRHNR
ncbi:MULTISPECIES: DUF1648 domain-containing protein [Butyricicoccus]|uniref:DUF1648 domain-containing protein n=1 Tax=Butyricicoccus porcorum TaxID=1945634 RepID=A0A252F5I8_9FIRM|nr:DUF1648 domain-containing protein [Butyricicoccus porcorum]MCI6927246.1 DUF1648 domain-containing protein [Butyricicoccus porcorum]OUM21024.1 hypothetical protein CBW42_05430 [Butyricicoccus porcorum]